MRNGTNGPGRNRWGDFLTARPASGRGNSWIGTSFTQQGPCASTITSNCANVEPRFVSFGRVRDNPFGPTAMGLSPNSTPAGGPGLTITVTGANFILGSTVLWNGSPHATTFSSSTRVQATITASDIAVTGTAGVTVQNPDTSVSTPALAFAITAPIPSPVPGARPGPPPAGGPPTVMPAIRPGPPPSGGPPAPIPIPR